MTCRREKCALQPTSSGCQEWYVPYYTVKSDDITPPIMQLSTYKKPEGGPQPRYRNTLLRTRGVNGGVVKRININTDLFIPILWIHYVHICASPYLHLQATRACSPCPVESGFGLGELPRCCHIPDFWAPKWSGLGRKAQIMKISFIRVLYSHI